MQLKLFICIAVLLSSPMAFASSSHQFCHEILIYKESTQFVRTPAKMAGCVGDVIGFPVGGLVGAPFGNIKGGAYIGGGMANAGFNAVLGLPFFVLEYLPRKLLLEKHESAADSFSYY